MSKQKETTILIVEDSPTQAIRLQYLLESKEYRVISAINGKVALEILDREIPSLVISDIVMPEMDGFQLCEKIKKDSKTENIPVILLTSLSDPDEVLDGLACGADSFINKPFNSEYLISNVESLLEEHSSGEEINGCPSIIINYDGKKRILNIGQQRIIKFLLNIYKGAIHQNKELLLVRDELTQLNEKLEDLVAERTVELRKSQEEVLLFNKDLERRIAERTAELEAANRAKSEFLANMSHEIRTPMNAVLGYAELLVLMLNDKTQKEYIESIKHSGQNLLTLINDILDLSKIEAGKFEFQYEYTNTNGFFEEFEKLFALRISDKNLKYVIDISPEIPEGIFIDSSRLRQVIINLLSNAIKFTDKGSVELKVFLENQKSLSNKEGNKEFKADLQIEVIDTGIGIPKDMQETIFQPFVQAQGQNNKKYGGTGLGLAISMRMVQLMNGDIDLISSPGRGSTFRISIPGVYFLKNYKREEDDRQINPSDIEFKKSNILIVDDVESNRKYLVDALRNTEFEIVEAENGEEAIEIARKSIPDLIITDILMEGVDGFELLKIVKNDPQLSKIPVVAYSAAVIKEQRERIVSSDFSGLLVKPVRVSDLYLELMKSIPYKVRSESGSAPDHLKSDEIEAITNLPVLISLLEDDYKQDWIALTQRQPIAKVKEFGRKMEETGKNYSAYILQDFGQELLRAADSFNVESILNLLKKYNGIIEMLKSAHLSSV